MAAAQEAYEDYRKAGHRKKFPAGYEGDILLHKAAKATFDKRGLKKLLRGKELSAASLQSHLLQSTTGSTVRSTAHWNSHPGQAETI